jgi:hypothetical protein
MRLCHAALVAMALSATIFIPSVQGDVVIYNNIPAPVPSSVPEPRGTSLLLVTALLGVGLVVRRRAS